MLYEELLVSEQPVTVRRVYDHIGLGRHLGSKENVSEIENLSADSQLNLSGVAPQVLRTCKSIHSEATSILYKSNKFQFILKCTRYRAWEGQQHHLAKSVKSRCGKSKKYDYDDPIEDSSLTRFIRQIGKENAACFKTIDFLAEDWRYRYGQRVTCPVLEVHLQLLRYYAPELRHLSIDQDIRGSSSYVYRMVGTRRTMWYEYEMEDAVAVESAIRDVLEELLSEMTSIEHVTLKGIHKNLCVVTRPDKI